ncbi:MAG TPA: beta-ketoacyl-ACP synthase III [Negativicutes bacterium]|nr:beta-ketoacyl-ACP synthase III [Negativicutes bacterium]
MSNSSAGIIGVGMYVPEKIMTNADLARMINTTEEWIESMSGIRERHIAAPSQAASDLGVIAAQRALARAGVSPDEVDLIIVSTVTPDMQFPSTACIIQERLGIKNIPAFDLTAVCSGFVYALTVGAQFISNEFYRTVLVIGTEVVSSVTNWTDRDTSMLIGDGAGAVVLRQAPFGYGILSAKLGADGAGASFMMTPAGGSRMPVTSEVIEKKMNKMQMDGPEVFKFAMKMLPEVTEQALELANLHTKDLNLIIPHQANRRIIEAAARRMELPMEKFMVNVEKYGNTSSATIPIALFEALETGRIESGDVIALTGFGGGLAWGSVIMRWI